MQHPYFYKTENDAAYYEKYLRSRLPEKILDMHSHMNLPEHVADIPASRINSDWALQAGFRMTADEAREYAHQLFETVDYSFVGFPFPILEADLRSNNRYIAACATNGKIKAGLMAVTPDLTAANLKIQLENGGFAGIKPYPDFVGAGKGSEVSIFDFLPREQIQTVWKLNKCILLHLPRAGRMADENNVRELREILSEFPGIRLIVAHLGRCFNKCYFVQAAEGLGADLDKLWFDTSAVTNPQVLRLAFTLLDPEKIMFGLDLPIFLWHGTRRWTEKTYVNLCRENLPWKRDIDPPELQEQYTFFVYEQVRNLLDAMDRCGWSEQQMRNYFYHNAEGFFHSCVINGGF